MSTSRQPWALLAAAACLIAGPAWGQSVSASAPATAYIGLAVGVTGTVHMTFGQIAKPANAGSNTFILGADGSMSMTGSGNGAVVPGTPVAATFDLHAPAGTTYTVVPVLNVPGLTASIDPSYIVDSGVAGTVPGGGFQILYFGASIVVDNATAPGIYTGVLDITVYYD